MDMVGVLKIPMETFMEYPEESVDQYLRDLRICLLREHKRREKNGRESI